MSVLTYDTTPKLAAPGVPSRPARKSFWKTFIDAMIESRLRQVELEMRRHRHMIPGELERAGWKITARSEDSLPFVR